MPAVVRVYQKNSDTEADAPPAKKSRTPMRMVFSTYKFVSKILSLNILHCCRGPGGGVGGKKRICIEEEHKRAGGDGFQL